MTHKQGKRKKEATAEERATMQEAQARAAIRRLDRRIDRQYPRRLPNGMTYLRFLQASRADLVFNHLP